MSIPKVRAYLLVAGAATVFFGCSRTPPATAEAVQDGVVKEGGTAPAATPAPPPPPPPVSVTLAAGSTVPVRLQTTISTKTATAGEAFEATLSQPLIVDGYRLADRGAIARGVVVSSGEGGRVKGRAQLAVRLNSITLANGKEAAIQTSPVYRLAPATKKKDAMKVGIASGVGAAIGAIAGGGKGAAIGAGAGAAGGTGVVLATRGAPAVLPVETALKFELVEPLTAEDLPKAPPVAANK